MQDHLPTHPLPLHQNGRNRLMMQTDQPRQPKILPRHSITNMPIAFQSSRSATRWQCRTQHRKCGTLYGTITATGSHQQYFVETRSSHVLVRNRCFLWKRTPVSITGPAGDQSPTPDEPPPPHSESPPTRVRRGPQHLIAEQTWMLSSSVPDSHRRSLGEV